MFTVLVQAISGAGSISANMAGSTSASPHLAVEASAPSVGLDPNGTGNVTGTVNDSNGDRLSGVTIVLSNASNTSKSYDGTTTASGNYRISNIPAGTYFASPEFKSYINSTKFGKNVTVSNNSTATVNFILTAFPEIMSGEAMFGDQPLADVTVTITSNDGAKWVVTTANNGTYFSPSALAPGNYTLSFSKSGYSAVTENIAFDPIGSTTYNVSMTRETLFSTEGFIPGYDLPHSLMIIALFIALTTLVITLWMQHRNNQEKKES